MSSAAYWTKAEVARAVDLHRAGISRRDIATALGRSMSGVSGALKTVGISFPRGRPSHGNPFLGCYDGPPIGVCQVEERLRANAVAGSQMLKDAILRLAE